MVAQLRRQLVEATSERVTDRDAEIEEISSVVAIVREAVVTCVAHAFVFTRDDAAVADEIPQREAGARSVRATELEVCPDDVALLLRTGLGGVHADPEPAVVASGNARAEDHLRSQ